MTVNRIKRPPGSSPLLNTVSAQYLIRSHLKNLILVVVSHKEHKDHKIL